MASNDHGDAELRVSTLELFFDLVFVFTLTQLTGMLSRHPTPETAFRVLLVFVVLFWMYGGTRGSPTRCRPIARLAGSW